MHMSDRDATYFVVRVSLKYGALERWYAIMPGVRASLEEQGWKLQIALSSVVGTVTELIHIWEVPDATNVWDTQLTIRNAPGVAELDSEAASILITEETQL